MKKDLVSIIMPCYNGEKFLDDSLTSIYNQTYSPIELIIVNDGSTDNTQNILESYKAKFEEKGIAFKCLNQENMGQSFAMNVALKHVNGEFLSWIDCDDLYEIDAIENLVGYMREHSANVVRGQSIKFKDNGKGEDVRQCISKYPDEKNVFDLYVFQKDTYNYAGIFLIRMQTFDQKIKNREIYTEKTAGQNWQLILPATYKEECGYLAKNVYRCRLVENSHSRSMKSYKQIIEYENTAERILNNTLERITTMPKKELNQYRRKLIYNFTVRKLKITIKYLLKKIFGKERNDRIKK